jgi:thiopeptide-type bacteriocin biosynthesis protein
MPPPPECRTADFFVLRSPGLPLDALSRPRPTWLEALGERLSGTRLEADREALRRTLRTLARREAVREAVALASPDLASRLDAWLDGALDEGAARGVERGLVKYFSRMSSRCTPFGLFAGVSKGGWGPENRLSVAPWQAGRKAVRLDWGVLETLVDRLERVPEVRSMVRYHANTSLFPCGGWHRYLEARDQDDRGRTYHLEAVEASPHLDFALQQAQAGLRLGNLATRLARHQEVDPAEAQAFLDQLVEAQVLRTDLRPPLTSPDPLDHVVTALKAHPLTDVLASPLAALGQELKGLQDAPLGAHPEGYAGRVPALAALELPPETRDVLQVDLFRPAVDLTLAPGVRRALEEGAELLRRLTPAPSPDGPLTRFRAAFTERYGTRWMPLLGVLDEESGIGFDGTPSYGSPLLEDLSFPIPDPPRVLTGRDRFLLGQVPRWQGRPAWELTEADVEALTPADLQPFPPAFAALASLAAPGAEALDQGDFSFWMEHYSGPTAARWLGRFASGDPDLSASLRAHLQKEEAARPEAVFAEVVHIPEGRMGNILARPALREFEIPFLATPGVPHEKAILPSDLRVTVRGDRVLLASRRLGREVIPRLSSAHNFARGPVVYRFLARLQDQDGRSGGWSWGALEDLPFLPRVTRGRHVLCKARWRIGSAELKAARAEAGGGGWEAFQVLRESRGLPRFVTLTDADNSLLVDLDRVLWVETLEHLVAHRASFILTECFPAPDEALVEAPEGRFAHELVIPFEAAPPVPAVVAPSPRLDPGAREVRAHAPGSEWLYLKLYCGPASADRLLVELEPLLRWTQAQGFWDRWHFIRFHDPDPHLRLRFHGLPPRLLGDLLPLIHRHLERYLAQGLLWRWQVDTFEPELERYGGGTGFALAEAWFTEDSDQVLGRLASGATQEDRWRAGLRETDAIWTALGLELAERRDLARATRDGLRKEFGDAGSGAVQMGVKFRKLRKGLEAVLAPPAGPSGVPGPAGLARLREGWDQGLVREDLPRLAGSLTHMHLNRLLRTDHRESEWVLMEFLTRLYESRLARLKDRAVEERRTARI